MVNISKVAAIQMNSSNIVEENLEKARQLITKAASNHAKLIVLPEMFAIMGEKDRDAVNKKEVYHSGVIQDFLSNTAAENDVWIVGGTIPIASQNEKKIRAASIVYSNKGEAVARYDKVHLFDTKISENESYKESNTIEPGRELVVVETPMGKLGLSVCYDLRFSGLFTYLLNKGAEIITVPAAFTTTTGKAHWRVLMRARAIENFCYVVGACQVGVHSNGRKTYGHSIIIDPWGSVIDEVDYQSEAIVYGDIDLNLLKKARASIPILEHQRIKPNVSGLVSGY